MNHPLCPALGAATAAAAAALLVAGLVALDPATLHAQGNESRARDPISQSMALVTFDSAWNRIRTTYYDTAMRGVDWYAVRDSLRPVAGRARTLGGLRTTITAMLSTLGESHFVLIPREAADAADADDADDPGPADARDVATPGDVGLTLRLIGDTVVVTAVRAGSAAERGGVQAGWIVDSVGRFSAARARSSIVGNPLLTRPQVMSMMLRGAAGQLAGARGSPVHAVFTDHGGRTVVKRLVRGPLPGTPVRFGNLPTMFVEVAHAVLPLPAGAGCAGVVRLNAWMLPAMARLDSAVDAVRHCAGIIVDLRGNPGGIGAMVMGFGGHFLDSTIALGEIRTRTNKLRFVANPRRADTRGQRVTPYAGALAIVVDSLSMSTSEIFAAGMKAVGRARIFGENTPGLALPAALVRLPTGDVLMHVVADFTDPNGRRIEGVGAVPDVLVPLDRAELRAGIDAPIAAAVAWIAGGQTGPGGPPHGESGMQRPEQRRVEPNPSPESSSTAGRVPDSRSARAATDHHAAPRIR